VALERVAVGAMSMWGRLAGLLDNETDLEGLVTKLLAVALGVAVLVVIGFAIAPIGTGDAYTEFYVLGQNGTASDYPDNVTVGEEATVQVGVANFESRELTYTLIVRSDETTFETRRITLAPDTRWEESVTVAFETPGRQRLRLELYRGETAAGEPYRSLRLFVEVLWY
jgi:uncharacterized membrane protein